MQVTVHASGFIEHPVKLAQGNPWAITLTVASDWTGTYVGQVRSIDGSTLIAALEVTATATDDDRTLIDVALTREQAETIPPGVYRYAARNTTSGHVRLAGQLEIIAEPIPLEA